MRLTIKQASKETSYSPDTIRDKVKAGIIPSTFENGRYLIEEEDLKPFVKRSKSVQVTQPETERSLQGAPFQPASKPKPLSIPILAMGTEAIQAVLDLQRLGYPIMETAS